VPAAYNYSAIIAWNHGTPSSAFRV